MKRAVVISTDPIADMLTRIRNGIDAGKAEVLLPHSRVKEQIAKILIKNGFLIDMKSLKTDDGLPKLKLTINPDGANSTITEISRVSRPGRRVYVKNSDIPVVKRGRGIVVISTSAGIMTGEEAKAKRLGGELLCEVY